MRPTWMTLLLAAGVMIALPGSASAERVWGELRRPRDHELIREPVGLVEVSGWAGTGVPGSHDVIIALDRTASTFEPSGVDVDGDGVVGKKLEGFKHFTVVSDPDDTIAAAQLLAARRLIEKLDTGTTRMGIVTFARTEKVIARIGTDRDGLMRALDELPRKPGPGGTYFYGALIASINVFERAPPGNGDRRYRSIIFLSDGRPNRPPPESAAAKAAVRASKHAANAKIRIFAFALGTEVAKHPEVFIKMVEANRGELMFVENPADIIAFVPHMSLTKLSGIEIENVTTGKSARAVRIFPDGSFDGYVPLAEGENVLRVTVKGEGGGIREIERTVLFEALPSDSDLARRRLEELLRDIKLRTLETQLAEEARRKREKALARQLEIRTEKQP